MKGFLMNVYKLRPSQLFISHDSENNWCTNNNHQCKMEWDVQKELFGF
jgi:hypothetical protein